MILDSMEERCGTMARVLQTIIPWLALAMLCGCGPSELHFKIRFDEIEGLKGGDSILFEGNSVGKVDEVQYTQDGDYLVEVTIQPNFANTATRNSQFFIIDNPQAEGKKAIEIIQEKSGGELLRDGEIVAGSVKPTMFQAVFDRLQKQARHYQGQMDEDLEKFKESLRQSSQELEGELENTLDDLSEQFSQFAEEIQKVPDSQELKRLEESLNRLAEEMTRSQETVRKKIQTELIPEIQERLDRLRDKLEKYDRQDEMDPLNRQLDELRKV